MRIISFSLFNNLPIYNVGAMRNLELAREIYPGWVCRFYVDSTASQECIQQLKRKGAQVIDMTGSQIRCRMLWRYLVSTEDDVECWVSRDVDSRVSQREKEAVDSWLSSFKKYHVMRDHPLHGANILGGTFGAKGRIAEDLEGLIIDSDPGDEWGSDQVFLAKHIMQNIKEDILIHDEFCFNKCYCLGAKNFPRKRKDWFFVGQIFDENEQINEDSRQALIDYCAPENQSFRLWLRRVAWRLQHRNRVASMLVTKAKFLHLESPNG